MGYSMGDVHLLFCDAIYTNFPAKRYLSQEILSSHHFSGFIEWQHQGQVI